MSFKLLGKYKLLLINQGNEEIPKINWRIDSYKI